MSAATDEIVINATWGLGACFRDRHLMSTFSIAPRSL
jgi:hypothetical protein